MILPITVVNRLSQNKMLGSYSCDVPTFSDQNVNEASLPECPTRSVSVIFTVKLHPVSQLVLSKFLVVSLSWNRPSIYISVMQVLTISENVKLPEQFLLGV
jgi:hypothetical protein